MGGGRLKKVKKYGGCAMKALINLSLFIIYFSMISVSVVLAGGGGGDDDAPHHLDVCTPDIIRKYNLQCVDMCFDHYDQNHYNYFCKEKRYDFSNGSWYDYEHNYNSGYGGCTPSPVYGIYTWQEIKDKYKMYLQHSDRVKKFNNDFRKYTEYMKSKYVIIGGINNLEKYTKCNNHTYKTVNKYIDKYPLYTLINPECSKLNNRGDYILKSEIKENIKTSTCESNVYTGRFDLQGFSENKVSVINCKKWNLAIKKDYILQIIDNIQGKLGDLDVSKFKVVCGEFEDIDNLLPTSNFYDSKVINKDKYICRDTSIHDQNNCSVMIFARFGVDWSCTKPHHYKCSVNKKECSSRNDDGDCDTYTWKETNSYTSSTCGCDFDYEKYKCSDKDILCNTYTVNKHISKGCWTDDSTYDRESIPFYKYSIDICYKPEIDEEKFKKESNIIMQKIYDPNLVSVTN